MSEKGRYTDTVSGRFRPLACLSVCLLFMSAAWGQSGLTKTLREADGGAHKDGYYNKADSQYLDGGLELQLAGLGEDTDNKIEFSKNGGGIWSNATKLTIGGGSYVGPIVYTGVAETTLDINITQTQLVASPYNMIDGETIQFRFIDSLLTAPSAPDTINCTITGGGNDLTYDITPPTISSVSSGTGDGIYGINDGINITVTFSEAATLTGGNLRVNLNTGTYLDIASGSYANDASGTYTVQVGDLAGTLNNTGVSITGGTLTDAAGNDVSNYVPASNLSATSAIEVDGVRPTITSVTSSTANGTYGIGSNINITVTFSEATTVAGGDLRVALDVGQNVDIAGATYNTTASGTYTIQVGDASGDLTTSSISITAGTIEDGAGNALIVFTPVSNLGASSILIIDGVRPTITSVNSSSASATFGIGDNIGISVYFSEPVTLASGNLLVELETGAIDQQAIITPFTGSSGTGTYTVQSGDVSALLNENSVTLSGGTLRDVAGNDLTVFTVPPAENLNDNKAIVVDGVRPTVSSVTSLSADGNYKIGDDILVQVAFTEAVTLSGGNLLITLETGTTDQQVTISSVLNSETATGTYTVQDGDENLDLTANVVGLSAGTLEDVGGNAITDFTIPPGQNIADLKAIVVDGVRPTIDYITSTTVSPGTYNIGDPVNVRLFFTEAVTTSGGGSIVITLETGAIDRQETISNVVSSLFADGTYTVQDGDESTDLNVTSVAMSAGSLVDDFGNPVTDFSIPGGSNLADAKALVIDGVRPTVTNVSATTLNGAYNAGDDIDITVEFSEVVDVLGLPTLNLDVGGGYLVSNPTGTGTNTLTFTYTVQAAHNTSDLDYVDANSLLTGGGSIRDAAGNDATLDLYDPGTGVLGAGSLGDNKDIVIDTQAPTVTNVTSSLADLSYKAGVTVPITVTFNEVVTVSGSPTLKLETGTTDRNAIYTGVSDSTLSFEYIVQAGDETNDLDYWDANSLTAGTYIRDAAGNDATLTLAIPGDPNSLGDNKALVIDTTPPTVSSVSSTAGDGYYVETDPIPITITFSEIVYVGGAGTPTLTLETGTSDALVNYVNGSDGDMELLFNYTVGSGHESGNLDYTGTTALELNLGTIRDAAGNDADLTLTAPGASSSLGFSRDRDIDAIIPTVTGVTSNKADGTYKAGVVIPISVAFSEAVAVAGGTPTLTLNVGGGYAVDYASGSGSDTLVFDYTVQAGQNQVNLDYLSAAALSPGLGTIKDVAGNDADLTLASPGAAGSLSDAKNLDIDTTPPVLSSVAPASSSYHNTTTVSYTLSEDLASGTITWNRTGGVADPGAPHPQALIGSELAQGAHSNITLSNDPTLVSGTGYSLTYYGADAAGNDTSIVRTGVSFDNTPPQASLAYSDTLARQGDTVTVTATLNEDAATSPQVPQINILYAGGTTVGPTDMTATADPAIWTYDAIMPIANDGSATITVDATDLAGNALTPGNTTGRTSLVVDNTAPGYVLSYTDSLVKAGDVLTVTATFEKPVIATPLLDIDFAGTGADLSSVVMSSTGSDSIWTHMLSAPSGNDGVAIATVTAADYAGNQATHISGSTALVVDNTAPTLTVASPDTGDYIPTTAVSYTIGETVSSGQVSWAWESGTADGASPHVQSLAGAELAAGAHTGVLTDAPTLVQGATYAIEFIVWDEAGNGDTVQVSSVTYDAEAPQAALTYSDTLARQGDTVTVTLTLTEAALDTPAITISYMLITQPSNALMTATADSLVWTYAAIIPSGNDGTATVGITADDLAGNALTAGNTTGSTDLVVDNTANGYVLAYSDSLVREGDVVTITATFDELLQSTPTIAIDFAGTGADTTGADMIQGAADTVWIYEVTIPSGNDGFATVTVTAYDQVGNTEPAISGSTNTLKVDNTPPDIALTDPVDDDYVRTTAISYTLGEDIASGWMKWEWEAGATDGNAPHTQALAGAEISAGAHTGVLTNAPTLVQAAAYTIQLIAGDGAGNYDTVAVTTVTYDTLAPAISGVVVTDGPSADVDSSCSTDTLAVHYGVFPEAVSGISRYEYALGSTPGGTDVVDWTANGTDTLATVRDLDLVYRYTYYFSVRATDGAGNVSDSVVSDGVIIVDKPRLTVNVVQNSVVARYIQILVTDTLAMADSIRILVDSVRVSPTVIDTFSYLGTHQLTETGTHSLQVTGFSGSGDTLRTASLGMSLAKRGETWIAASVDQHFTAVGLPGAVSEDRHLLVIDSTLMATGSKPGGAYRLGDGRFAFREPVQVSMLPDPETRGEGKAQAIYILRADGRWEELPSVDDGDRISAWARKTGTFRLGRRTIMVPQTTHLRQNYPNPFNPATRIIFDLGLKDGPVQSATVKVYDLLGRQIRTLYHGQATIGRYELVWAGSDDRGVQVASGIYFVQLTTSSGYRQTRKMLLIR